MTHALTTGDPPAQSSAQRGAPVTVKSLSCCTAPIRQSQEEISESLARLWNLSGARRSRWDRIVAGAAIQSRSAVVPINEAPMLSTGERMRLYEDHAPTLAEQAARAALQQAGIAPCRITDVIVVSCTGFSSPGVDVELQGRLGLSPDARRATLGFMGCFGAITGLRAALGAVRSEPEATALLVCVELCSLHLRRDDDPQNLVASALFSDGAAAAVISADALLGSGDCSHPLHLQNPGRSRLITRHRDDMTWRITDEGFAMTLSAAVPPAIERALPEFLTTLEPAPRAVAIHPGGAAILDAAERSLPPHLARHINAARDVLRAHGNMSSPTVLFVLEQLVSRGVEAPIALLAFGPGLTIDSITLESARAS